MFESAAKEEKYLRKYYLKRAMNGNGLQVLFKDFIESKTIKSLNDVFRDYTMLEIPTEKF